MKKISLVIFVLVGFFCSIINAQEQLKGKIVDAYSELPVEEAYIYNTVSKSHTHSDDNGLFFLENVSLGDSLTLGLLGYETKRHIVKAADFKGDLMFILEEKALLLDELVITESLNLVNTITRLDIKINPVKSSQGILQKVPGLIIGQHAGGGKAEQIFLRGFDIDHGTDIALSVDDMPVNMVSHAHGQGYSDLHFIIPETINKIDFAKGPYYADKGDFNTAGYTSFNTKDALKESSVTLSSGQFNTLRVLGQFNMLKSKNQNAYIVSEYLLSDGPFESPQNFNRFNLFGKFVSYLTNSDKLALSVSHFTSRWDASGQIPLREVNNKNISRFGAIDNTEGGFTSRTNANVEFQKYLNNNSKFKANAFYSKYDFELYSNFTFFLEDAINGDQIRQKEDRQIFGFNTEIGHDTKLGNTPLSLTAGLNFRHDIVDNVELSKSANRITTLENIQLGDINQTNISAYINSELKFNNLKIHPGLRLDYFKFLYNDDLQSNFETQSETKITVNPKLNFYYDASSNLQLYFKSGIGFHSNDARVVISQSGRDILPKAYGSDLGTIWKATPKLLVNAAAWYLFLEQEFVYVGDAGIVEPSDKTERYGLDLGLRYQFNDWLYLDVDATYTNARSIENTDGEDYIPLAPDFTLTGGLSIKNLSGFSGGLRYRFLNDRPANEDFSITAKGYFVTDLNVNYSINNIDLGVVIENLFDVEWSETQFATESRLQDEVNPVEEIHFTPGTPFFIRGSIKYNF